VYNISLKETVFLVFDVLAVDGQPCLRQNFKERMAIIRYVCVCVCVCVYVSVCVCVCTSSSLLSPLPFPLPLHILLSHSFFSPLSSFIGEM
jgi:hypothetical protein